MELVIIYKAIEALEKAIPLKAEWIPGDDPGKPVDGELIVLKDNKKYRFYAEIKKNLRTVNLPQLGLIKEKYNNLIVITEVIYPQIREQLRNRQINYLDTTGNLYIHQEELFLYVEGKKIENLLNEPVGRAFNKAGLRFIFYLLTNKDFIAKTYREIAEKCDTALGNINYIINDLHKQDFLRKGAKGAWYINKREELIKEWVVQYEKKLKPAYLLGNFRFLKDQQLKNWKDLDIDYNQTRWGGEPAADILTNYLKPAVLTLYTTEKRMDLLKKYQLVPDDNGYIKIYNKILNDYDRNTRTVNPLVIYADLINTMDPRTDELANMIYNEYLKG
ncbi:MAG: hypothetical protein JW973_15405 [Bacteroidales bacterium]|nr:hypothetical protein [Bacteroidales bacterium]